MAFCARGVQVKGQHFDPCATLLDTLPWKELLVEYHLRRVHSHNHGVITGRPHVYEFDCAPMKA